MRVRMLLCVALVTDCYTTRRGSMPDEPRSAVADERALCALAAGELAGWRGLVPFDPARVPACFGPRAETGTVLLHDRDWHFQHFVSANAESWLYDDGAAVALITVIPSSPPHVAPVEAALGPAPWLREVSFAERIERAAMPPLARYEGEMVYADRGLALLVAASPDRLRVVHRVRGFAPTDARGYFRRFVQERPVEWRTP